MIGAWQDPGRLGRSAYTYFHLPMIAGIVLSTVGDETVIARPDHGLGWTRAVLVLGGPALFVAGHALYKWSLTGHVPVPRAVAAPAAVVALVPLARLAPPVAAELVPVAVIAVVAALDAVRVSRNVVTQSAWSCSGGNGG